MEQIVTEIQNVIISRNQSVYILYNGVEISLPTELIGTSQAKRDIEARSHAERLYDDVKRLKLL